MDLTNQFLVAMPTLADPNFSKTVTYMCAHNDEGAMGIVVNRPLDLELSEILNHMEIPVAAGELGHKPILQGGPMQRERGFVIHSPPGDWDAVLSVGEDIAIATSRDILSALAQGRGPSRAVIALGYAGWGAGQLEQELGDNSWLSVPFDAGILFDEPFEYRWAAAAKLLGVDISQLSSEAGHG